MTVEMGNVPTRTVVMSNTDEQELRKEVRAYFEKNDASLSADTEFVVALVKRKQIEARYEAIKNEYEAGYTAKVVDDFLQLRHDDLTAIESLLPSSDNQEVKHFKLPETENMPADMRLLVEDNFDDLIWRSDEPNQEGEKKE